MKRIPCVGSAELKERKNKEGRSKKDHVISIMPARSHKMISGWIIQAVGF
jgi:hypothetical protein